MTAPLRETDITSSPVTTGEELGELLAAQHEELVEAWGRVAQLHAGAREDVFLHARRMLAVHVVLEQVLLAPRLGDGGSAAQEAELDRAVRVAEREDPGSGGFDAACARVLALLLRHSAAQERLVLTGLLPAPEREAVDTALALWDGSGDAYLGNAWAEMCDTAVEQLSRD